MISFKDGRTVKKYKVNIHDSVQAKKLIDEMLDRCTMELSAKREVVYSNYGNYESFRGYATEDTIVGTYIRPCSYTQARLEAYCPAEIHTTKYTFLTPYTLALAAQSFKFSKIATIDQSRVLRRSQTSSSLASVVKSSKIDGLERLLSTFDGDYDALNSFLKSNYPDLFYLRRYLECISLSKSEEYEAREDEEDERKKETKIATSNVEVSKKLDLKFMGRDFL